jgi:hypothetical protein
MPQRAHIRIERCEFYPRGTVIEPGGLVLFEAVDRGAQDVTMISPSGREQTVFLPAAHARQSIRLHEPGTWTLRTPQRPWSWGQILVTKGYQVDKTDSRGNYRFMEIPTDTYDLLVWHPSIFMSPQKKHGLVVDYRLGPPLTLQKRVKVAGRRTEVVPVDLAR